MLYFMLIVEGDVFAGENRQFEEQRLALVKSIKLILVEEGVCITPNDCSKKNVIFASPGILDGVHGVGVALYGVNSNKVIQRIANECWAVFIRENQTMSITFSAYKTTKEEDLKIPFWRSNNPYVTIELKRVKE